MLLHRFDNLLPWKQSKMATKHNYLKNLKLQSHCVQINFLFTVHTNIMLSSLLLRILWLLCFSFILLYYLHFMLVKMIPMIFQISIKLKQISPSTNHDVKVKINTYTNKMQTFKTHSMWNRSVLQLWKRCKSEKVRKCTWKERKASYLIWIPLTFDKLYMLKTLCMQNKLLHGYKRC